MLGSTNLATEEQTMSKKTSAVGKKHEAGLSLWQFGLF